MATMSLSDLLKPTGDFVRRLTTVRAQEAKVTVGLDVGSTSVKAVACPVDLMVMVNTCPASPASTAVW